MKCHHCNKNTATFHYVERQNDQIKKDIHLCEDCARQKGIQPVQFSLSSLLGPLLDPSAGPGGGKIAREMADVACPSCGLTYAEFRQRTRLGCAKDYEVFQRGLTPLLEKIHGSTRHAGKAPPQAGADVPRRRELIELRRSLDRFVKEERYEDAARTRDRIRALEEELKTAGDAGAAPAAPE